MAIYDEDLFEDNDGPVNIESINIEDNPESEQKLFTDSPKFHKLISHLRQQLKDVNSFNFELYTRTYYSLLDHIQYLFRAVSDPVAVNFIVNLSVTSDAGSHSYEQLLQLKEFERSIVASGYFNDTIGHLIAKIKDDPKIFEEGSYIKYVYEHLLQEYNFSNTYLTRLIDSYISFCDQYNFDVDPFLVEHQMKSFITVTERQFYGNYVHAINVQHVGEISFASDKKDEFNSTTADYLASVIFIIQKTITDITDGNLVDLQAAFN